jgi:hypothetical protein
MELYSHLNSIVIDKPSLFEHLAVDSLHALLKPALQQALFVFTQRYPRSLLWIYSKFDTLYFILHLIVESYYLSEWGASFAEHFYGLKRSVSKPWRSIAREKLDRFVLLKSLIGLCILPHLQSELDRLHEKWNQSHLFQDFLHENVSFVIFMAK